MKHRNLMNPGHELDATCLEWKWPPFLTPVQRLLFASISVGHFALFLEIFYRRLVTKCRVSTLLIIIFDSVLHNFPERMNIILLPQNRSILLFEPAEKGFHVHIASCTKSPEETNGCRSAMKVSLRWLIVLSMTVWSSIKAMIDICPPHFGHSRRSTSHHSFYNLQLYVYFI